MYNKLLCIVLTFIVSCFNIANAFETFKTPQGQIAIVEEMPNNPIVTIDTWIKTGSVNETDINSGVSHFLEHLFFKGTKKRRMSIYF
jgi:predicted Zn-dependent peptidase